MVDSPHKRPVMANGGLPSQQASNAWDFMFILSKQAAEQTSLLNLPVIWDDMMYMWHLCDEMNPSKHELSSLLISLISMEMWF